MLKDIFLRTEPINVGETRELRVEAAGPVKLEIKCFVSNPPPAGFRGCPECGSFSLKSGEPHFFRAPDGVFRAAGGKLLVLIMDDSDKDEERYELDVVGWGNPTAGNPQEPTEGVAPPDTGKDQHGDENLKIEEPEVAEVS